MTTIPLGCITAPSGSLLLIDTGYLNMWSHDKSPVMPAGTLSSNEATEKANAFVDLKLVGKDAVKAGQMLGWYWHPGYAYDQGPEKGRIWQALDDLVTEHGFDAHFEVLAERIPHIMRAHQAIEYGQGAGEIVLHGLLAVAIGGLPAGVPLAVTGNLEDTYERWDTINIQCRDGEVNTEQFVGCIYVDHARIMIADLNALGSWVHDGPIDGLADYVFWGLDAEKVALQFEVPWLSESQFGWVNIPIDEAVAHGVELEQYRDDNQLRFTGDFRPHSHHWQVLRDTRASNTNSATIEIDGARLMNFWTMWGDGKYDVYRDMDANGSLLRIRIDLATPAKPAFQKMLEQHRQLD